MRADTEEAAGRLAALLCQERADVLLSYDPNGGYGHRDHVKVHEVGKRAAQLAGVATILEATLPREVVERLVRLARVLRLPLPFDPTALGAVYRPGASISHQINVRRFARQKQAALACHRSVVHGRGGLAPVMRMLVRLPSSGRSRSSIRSGSCSSVRLRLPLTPSRVSVSVSSIPSRSEPAAPG